MLKLTTTSYFHLFNTLNFNIFVHKSRSNVRGIQLVYRTTPSHPLLTLTGVYPCSFWRSGTVGAPTRVVALKGTTSSMRLFPFVAYHTAHTCSRSRSNGWLLLFWRSAATEGPVRARACGKPAANRTFSRVYVRTSSFMRRKGGKEHPCVHRSSSTYRGNLPAGSAPTYTPSHSHRRRGVDDHEWIIS